MTNGCYVVQEPNYPRPVTRAAKTRKTADPKAGGLPENVSCSDGSDVLGFFALATRSYIKFDELTLVE